MSTEPTRPGSIERGRLIAESMMDHATAGYRQRLAEEGSGMPDAPAVEPVEPQSPSVGGTGSRTGGLNPEGSAQAAESTPAELLEAARQALISEAREAHQHEKTLGGWPATSDASRQVAYGQAIGAQSALAAFLAVLAGDSEFPDPTDQARAYAEGRDLEETIDV
jgi:hypothetical protein